MTTIAEIAVELGVSRLEARRIIADRIREALASGEKPRTTTAWSEGEILDALRRFVATTGRLPTKSDYDPHGSPALPSRKTIGRRFGTCAVALERAGLVEIEQGRLFEVVR